MKLRYYFLLLSSLFSIESNAQLVQNSEWHANAGTYEVLFTTDSFFFYIADSVDPVITSTAMYSLDTVFFDNEGGPSPYSCYSRGPKTDWYKFEIVGNSLLTLAHSDSCYFRQIGFTRNNWDTFGIVEAIPEEPIDQIELQVNSNSLTVSSDQLELKKVSIFNLQGQLLKEVEIPESRNQIRVHFETLSSAGIYLTRIQTSAGTLRRKFYH